jgi:hypothetical protein
MKRLVPERFFREADRIFPEEQEAIEEFRKALEAGKVPKAPRNINQCDGWEKAWIYIAKVTNVEPTLQLRFENNGVHGAVCVGRKDGRKWLQWLKKFHAKLGPHRELTELRLIDCSTLQCEMPLLESVFPKARILSFTQEDWDRNLEISDANYRVSPES